LEGIVSIVQTIKNHPMVAVLGSAGSIIAIITALFALDARYAHANETRADKVQIQHLIKETSKTLRTQMLEDKLFELDIKIEQQRIQRQQPSPVDMALKERYKRQLDELTSPPPAR
jgi:hypothetical protein